MRLDGKTVLVTGGGTGIGAAIAERFAAEGAKVLITGRRAGPVEETAARIGAIAVVADAAEHSDAERVAARAAELGGLDVVVANAGLREVGSVGEVSDADWARSIEANLTTAFVTIRAALPQLSERRGAIVVMSSLVGRFSGPRAVAYVTAKHALIGMTRSLAVDYGSRGVRVNALCPGWVRTPLADELMDGIAAASGSSREDAYRLATADLPLRRPAEPAEVAAACLFLASDEAAAITGTTLFVDAGASAVDLASVALGRSDPGAE